MKTTGTTTGGGTTTQLATRGRDREGGAGVRRGCAIVDEAARVQARAGGEATGAGDGVREPDAGVLQATEGGEQGDEEGGGGGSEAELRAALTSIVSTKP